MAASSRRGRRGDRSDEVVLDALSAVSRALVALTARSVNELGAQITLTQYRTLVVLASRGPQRTADLAVELGVAPSTVTRLCDRLVGRGLARRETDGSDRRVVWVVATVAGEDIIGRAMSNRRRMIADFLAGVHVYDPEVFAATLTALASAAGEAPDSARWRSWQRSDDLGARLAQPA